MPSSLQIAPNRPLTVALVDPEGIFDFDLGMGRYQTTSGQLLTLPRPAVILLNTLDPRPEEEIVITKHWSGRPGEKAEWTIALSPRSENARAAVEAEGQEPAKEPERYMEIPPTLPASRKPAKRQTLPALMDQGNGTHGPLPALQPAAIAAPPKRPERIPANIATREILAFVNADPSTANWSADARQDLCSTILIASFKAGYIGLWERGAE